MTDQGKKFLSDILQAIEIIESFVYDIKDFDNYLTDLKIKVLLNDNWG